MKHEVVQFENGFWGVKFTDEAGKSMTVAAGMSERRAIEWCDRLRLRFAWGI